MAAKKVKRSSFRVELTRAALVLAAACGLGLAVNAASSRSLALWGGPAAEVSGETALTAKISTDELAELLKRDEGVLILDVRDAEQYEKGHLPNSLHAPIDVIHRGDPGVTAALENASKNGALIVTLCDSEQCGKAEQAAETLRKLGYKNVRVLLGGWEAYSHSGAQVESGPQR